MTQETIFGQIPGKANHYQAVPDGHGGRRIIKDETIRAYERSFCQQCKVYRNKAIDRPFRLYAVVYHSSNRYDIDNSIKTLLDCLQYARAITDDKYCVALNAEKRIDKRNPRVTFAIEEQEPRFL